MDTSDHAWVHCICRLQALASTIEMTLRERVTLSRSGIGVLFSRFRRVWKNAIQATVAIAALAIVARFAYVVSHIDGGWSMVAARWRMALRGGDARTEEAIAVLEPPRQAAFWLKHVDEIANGPGNPAQLAMGAAWLLDYPSPRYLSKHLQAPFGPALPLSVDDTEKAVSEVHTLCGAKCLAWARRATDMEPANVNWWRMRALLTSALNLGSDAIDNASLDHETAGTKHLGSIACRDL